MLATSITLSGNSDLILRIPPRVRGCLRSRPHILKHNPILWRLPHLACAQYFTIILIMLLTLAQWTLTEGILEGRIIDVRLYPFCNQKPLIRHKKCQESMENKESHE